MSACSVYADQDDSFQVETLPTYQEYFQTNAEKATSDLLSVPVALKEFKSTDDSVIWGAYRSYPAMLQMTPQSSVSFEVSIPASGLYCIQVSYLSMPGSNAAAVRNIKIDGDTPFYEASVVEFPRVWADADKSYKEDNIGNQIIPTQNEIESVQTIYLRNSSGLSDDILSFYLTKGTHTLSIDGVREPLGLLSAELRSLPQYLTYAEVERKYKDAGYTDVKRSVPFQAEHASAKSDATIYPLNDRSSPLTIPVSDQYVRYNVIGGTKWQTAGQWIEWNFTVPETGLYTMNFRYQQNLKRNSRVYRRLLIDGDVPFAEAETIAFKDASGFNTLTLGDGKKDYRFYLTKDETHTLRLEVVTGEFGPVLEQAQTLVKELNQAYREILMLTGPSPDLYRDYDFQALIPETLKKLVALEARLGTLEMEVSKVTGWDSGSELSEIQRIRRTMQEMIADDTTIAARFKSFQDNISGLAAWVLDTRNMPLVIDYFTIGPATGELLKKENFFLKFVFQMRQFVSSFTNDYSQLGRVGSDEEESITVWLQTGRDQSQIIRALINQGFTSDKGIGVELQLVAAGSLLPAIIAGLGPDVALQLGQGDPLNYAFRGAVEDLSTYPGAEEIQKRFLKEALVPFKYKDHLYALPESQSFQMLFYRKDILSELSLKKSDIQTWSSIFKVVIPELQKNYLAFGLQPSLGSYAMLLYQNGGTVYTEDGKEANLTTDIAVTTYQDFIKLYREYLQPVAFDFANRFRTGQMPIAVMDFTAFNQLSVFAPEIAGLWEMAPLPGVYREDGTINRTSMLTVSSSVLFSYSKHKDASWEFLKWWTEAKTQMQYGKNMESILGTSARYNSANMEAFASVAWVENIRKAILEQTSQVRALPEVPGGYYTGRNFDFAYRQSINKGREARAALTQAVKQINDEIANKRLEFGLD